MEWWGWWWGQKVTELWMLQKEQDSLSLNSYVVASSVGNLSIRDLKDPVRIQIAHLTEQVRQWGQQ